MHLISVIKTFRTIFEVKNNEITEKFIRLPRCVPQVQHMLDLLTNFTDYGKTKVLVMS